MRELEAYPKIISVEKEEFLLAADCVVDVEEKVDGSQASFAVVGGELVVYSKGARIRSGEKGMFGKLYAQLESIKHLIPPSLTFRGEYLQKPRHNVLAYARVPAHNIIVFDVTYHDGQFATYQDKATIAKSIELEVVPLLAKGAYSAFKLQDFLGTQSVLGGQNIEGVVVKPHDRSVIGKYVSPQFKEVMTEKRSKARPPKDAIIETLISELATTARWQKAVIHLRERGEITGTKRDIGPLLKEAGSDMHAECESYVKEKLFAWAWPQVSKGALRSLPEWYLKALAGGEEG